MLVLGTDFQLPFHGLLEFALLTSSRFRLFLAITALRRLVRLNAQARALYISGSVGFNAERYRNVNLFPIWRTPIKVRLRTD